MAAYGLDIPQIMKWTYPQLRLLGGYLDRRKREERRWQLVLASGMMSQEAFEEMWASLGGEDIQYVGSGAAPTGGSSATTIGKQSHAVDRHGNVLAPGAPLLSDIALGKTPAPSLIPITIINKSDKGDEDNGSECSPTTTG